MKNSISILTLLFFAVLALNAQPDKNSKGHGKPHDTFIPDECFCDDGLPVLLGTYEYTWDALNNDWLKKYVTTNIYNDEGKLTETVWKEFETHNNYTRYLYFYDDNGFNTERITQEWDGTDWVNTIRFIYSLNESGLRTQLLYMVWNGSEWTYYERHVYYFNEEGLYKHYIRYQYVNGDWVERTINRYYYDDQWNPVNRTESRLSDGLLTVRYLFTYDASNLRTEYLRQVWEVNQWKNTIHVDYHYNQYDQLSESIVTTWTSDTWVNTSRTVYLYESHHGGKNRKVTVCHNGHPICISINALPAHLAHGDYLGDCNTEPHNMPRNCLDNKNSGTGTGNKKSATVEEANPGILPEASGLHIYPNPVKDQLTISLGENKLNITRADLIDFSGRIVKTIIFSGSTETTISCDNLTEGMYILRLKGDRVINEKFIISK
jgi:hypothetical protein